LFYIFDGWLMDIYDKEASFIVESWLISSDRLGEAWGLLLIILLSSDFVSPNGVLSSVDLTIFLIRSFFWVLSKFLKLVN